MIWFHGDHFGDRHARVRQGVNFTLSKAETELVVRVGPWQWYVAHHARPNSQGTQWFWDRAPVWWMRRAR